MTDLLVPITDDEITPLSPVENSSRLEIRRVFDRWAVVSLVVYGLLGLIPNLPSWPGDPNHLRNGDLSFMTWGLAWTPNAILHGHSLVSTNWLNFPVGLNLLDNTTIPLLGILTAPLTLAVSPISSMNLLLWLSFPLSAFAVYFVLRQVGISRIGAFVGGLFYGFSPYMAGQGHDHLVVAFVPLPPLILFATFVLFCRTPERPLRVGIALGLLLAAQFFISSEVMATTLLVGALGLGVLALARPYLIVHALVHARSGVLVAGVIVAVLVGWPVWLGLTGAQHVKQSLGGTLSADLLGPLIPTSSIRFHSSLLIPAGNNLVGGDYPENGSYLGLPLVLLLGLIAVRFWRDRWVRFATAMVLSTFVLSLGARLVVNGHVTSIPLPFAILDRFPLLKDVADTGIALYSALFVAVLLGLGIDHGRRIGAFRLHSPSTDTTSGIATRRKAMFSRAALAAMIVGSVVLLIPNWPYDNSPAGTPAYFTSAASKSIPTGSVVLVLPLPTQFDNRAEVWQAIDHMNYRIVGGYAIFRGPDGLPDPYPAVLAPSNVEEYLAAAELGQAPLLSPTARGGMVGDLRSFLANNDVGTITFSPYSGVPDRVTPLVRQAIGAPSIDYQGTEVWYHAAARAKLEAS